MTVVISITVEGENRYSKGTAVVRIDGAVHAFLRTGESYEIVIPDPTYATRRREVECE